MKQNFSLKGNTMDISKYKCGMVASRDTVDEAMSYAYKVLETMDPQDRIAGMTALHVVLNTVIETIEKEG